MRILCFGDSNTWGYIPATNHERYDRRWPVILQELLRDSTIIEEGLNSRTFNTEEKREGKEGRAGLPYFIPCLDTHDPIDVVIIGLGLNDAKTTYSLSAEDIQQHCEELVTHVNSRLQCIPLKKRKCVLIAPNLVNTRCEWVEFEGQNEKIAKLFELYSDLDVDGVVDARDLDVGDDGVHLTQSSHEELARRVAKVISQL